MMYVIMIDVILYQILDVSTHRKGDRAYWSNIYDNCFNKDVGSALYSYLREINTEKFQPQDYPITKNKLKSISKRLDTVYLFLKNEFILQHKHIEIRLTDLYNSYKVYCSDISKKPCGKMDFVSKLSEIQINHYDSCGNKKYKVSLDTLKTIADKNKWITDLDEYDVVEQEIEVENPLDNGVNLTETKKIKKIKKVVAITEK